MANNNSSKDYQINDAIRVSGSVRVIGENEQLGIMSLSSAKNLAYSSGLDLVLMSPNANPPVCKIMDYGKFCYERDKKEKEAKKHQQVTEIKEVQLSCKIDNHDFETKANRAVKFLSEGNKVRVVLRFKGRELAHQKLGRDLLDRFEEFCREYGAAEKRAVLDGRRMILQINPIKKKPEKSEKKQPEAKASEAGDLTEGAAAGKKAETAE
ncbi:MAG: translation initiation factor IF-3 [Firmicutes bacterium]|nr:translation initiation factor IF-3 [Bacillota bacterium]MCD7783775.1 translation initiation factor IF-3 [Bacillota bacterium]